MSRLAKKALPIPSGVKVAIHGNEIAVEGPKGKMKQVFLNEFVEIIVSEKDVLINRKGNSKPFRSYQGLYWSLLKNALYGVANGFTRTLAIQGVGYKWEVKGRQINLNVGFSHPVVFSLPDGVEAKQENPNLMILSSFDKHLLGQTAANLRFVKPPEPYKGKGVRYQNEVVKLKEGKSAKK